MWTMNILDQPIFVAGHRGLVGSAIIRRLHSGGYSNLLSAKHEELDLRNQQAVEQWFEQNRPTQVYLVAGKVGGILANSTYPAQFIYDNLMIHANVIEAARKFETEKLLYLGSSCIYPRNAQQPISEEELLTGTLEPTNESYAIAKIAGIKMCDAYRVQYGCNFISAMPTNLYGPNDNFNLDSGHVLPALLRKFHEAKISGNEVVDIWGSGNPRREFLHVDDLADACIFLMENYNQLGHINIGSGTDIAISELAEMISSIVHPGATLRFDTTKPDGTPRKLLNVDKLHNLGWRHSTQLRDGLERTYNWFTNNLESALKI
jgi:GDP-L-fucose synthase